MGNKIDTLHPKGDLTTDLYPNIISDNIPNGAITNNKIADNTISGAKLTTNSVDTNKIYNKAVTTIKLNDYAVTAIKIADGNITADKLSASCVTTAKIDDSAVTTNKINDGAVTTAKINDSAITRTKIQNTAVTRDKLLDHIYHCVYNVASSVGITFQVELLSRYDINGDELSVDDFFDYLADYYCSEGGSCVFTKAIGGTLYGTLGDEGNGYIDDNGAVEFTDNNDESITIAHNTCTITTISLYQLY